MRELRYDSESLPAKDSRRGSFWFCAEKALRAAFMLLEAAFEAGLLNHNFLPPVLALYI